MKKEKIIVDFLRDGKILAVRLVQFPDELRGHDTIISDGTYYIKSLKYTQITPFVLYLSGVASIENDVAVYSFKNTRSAKMALKHFKRLINIYNISCAGVETTVLERAE